MTLIVARRKNGAYLTSDFSLSLDGEVLPVQKIYCLEDGQFGLAGDAKTCQKLLNALKERTLKELERVVTKSKFSVQILAVTDKCIYTGGYGWFEQVLQDHWCIGSGSTAANAILTYDPDVTDERLYATVNKIMPMISKEFTYG